MSYMGNYNTLQETNKSDMLLKYIYELDFLSKKIYSLLSISYVGINSYGNDLLWEKEISNRLSYVSELESLYDEAFAFLDSYEKDYMVMLEKIIAAYEEYGVLPEEKYKHTIESIKKMNEERGVEVNKVFFVKSLNLSKYSVEMLKSSLNMAIICRQAIEVYIENLKKMRKLNECFIKPTEDKEQTLSRTPDIK